MAHVVLYCMVFFVELLLALSFFHLVISILSVSLLHIYIGTSKLIDSITSIPGFTLDFAIYAKSFVWTAHSASSWVVLQCSLSASYSAAATEHRGHDHWKFLGSHAPLRHVYDECVELMLLSLHPLYVHDVSVHGTAPSGAILFASSFRASPWAVFKRVIE